MALWFAHLGDALIEPGHAAGINDAGVIVGHARTFRIHPVAWVNGTHITLHSGNHHAVESGVAYAINASGQIAGKGVYDAFATGGLGAAQHSGFAHARCPMLTREPPSIGNLFQESATPAKGERFDTLLAHGNLVVERIVSSANVTPVECVQPQDEWVVLLRGKATLAIQDR